MNRDEGQLPTNGIPIQREKRPATNTKHAGAQSRRPTIAVVSDMFTFSYPIDVLHGVTDTAKVHGVDVLYAAGGPLHTETGEPSARSFVLNLVGPDNADGIIIVSSLLATASSREEFMTFCEQYEPIPTVSVGLTLPGIPSIIIANYSGIYDEMAHLIDVHGYRKIAFIRGPEGHQEADERFRGYTDALAAHGIPIDPTLIVTGQFSAASGEHAIATLLDRRGVAFEAVVAASDQTALGALEALEARGIRVPGQVAIAGFDDIDEARCANPALTTVRQPYYAMGARAFETLLALMNGKDVPEEIQVPTECMIRESCGCLSQEITYAMEKPVPASEPVSSYRALITARMPEILQELAIGSSPEDQLPAWLDTLLYEFCQDLETVDNTVFVPALYEVLRQAIKAGDDVDHWQYIISVLRRQTMSASFQPAQQIHAEHLWQQARLVVDQMARQTQDARLIRAKKIVGRMRDLGGELLTTLHVAELLDVLARQLPRLGIPRCYLALYEEIDAYRYPQPPPEWARLVLAYTEQGRLELPPDGQRFPSHWLLPPNSLSSEQPSVMVVTSLDFQNQLLGFVVFEDRLEEKLLYRDLRLQVSSALHGALLVRRLQERSAELTRQQYVLNTFMENVPDRIYFKDLESRFTRANKAHAHYLGVSNPAQEIGKSDWDFFPKEQAQAKYEREQQIIRTGQPILGLEEPDGTGHWALTTKMPLRDEHGDIIGTFGISHDITELKQAQAELQRAYADIEQRVEERTAELQLEIVERKQAEAEREALIVELETKNAELERFTYTVSHDLKSPLITIGGFVGFLEKDALTGNQEQIKADVAHINDAVSRMQRLLNELLELSRIGRQMNPPGAASFEAIVRDAVDLAHGRIELHDVQVEIASRLPIVYGDRARLVEVVQNLVDNACKFMGEQLHPKIEIGARERDGTTVFYVHDNGIGIEPQYHNQVFGLFEKLDPQSEGTGIGLALVRRIIETHSGKIWVESEGTGRGSTFYFTLPDSLG
ncbi:MAG: substrate-binding domain-containing protein [Anaerolineae bacterium]|nr:substrate-binding domain-containing protein [Anaerolineae bacterium]